MKFRTDFVTNSSSSSYVICNIENAKLSELYRESGFYCKGDSISERFSDDLNTSLMGPEKGSISEWLLSIIDTKLSYLSEEEKKRYQVLQQKIEDNLDEIDHHTLKAEFYTMHIASDTDGSAFYYEERKNGSIYTTFMYDDDWDNRKEGEPLWSFLSEDKKTIRKKAIEINGIKECPDPWSSATITSEKPVDPKQLVPVDGPFCGKEGQGKNELVIIYNKEIDDVIEALSWDLLYYRAIISYIIDSKLPAERKRSILTNLPDSSILWHLANKRGSIIVPRFKEGYKDQLFCRTAQLLLLFNESAFRACLKSCLGDYCGGGTKEVIAKGGEKVCAEYIGQTLRLYSEAWQWSEEMTNGFKLVFRDLLKDPDKAAELLLEHVFKHSTDSLVLYFCTNWHLKESQLQVRQFGAKRFLSQDPRFECMVNPYGEITIMNYLGDEREVIVPEKINGKPVVAIFDYAFSGASLDADASRPKVEYVEYSPEQILRNREITHIYLPDTIREIGNHAFVDCKSLQEMTIPKQVTCFPSFSGCSALTKVHLPKTVSTYGDFIDCTNLEFVDLSGAFPLNYIISSPSFRGCKRLKYVVMPDEIHWEIDKDDFNGCDEMEEICLVSSRIKTKAFDNCPSLRDVYIILPASGFGPDITKSAFNIKKSPNLAFHGKNGSGIETYAESIKATFVPDGSIEKKKELDKKYRMLYGETKPQDTNIQPESASNSFLHRSESELSSLLPQEKREVKGHDHLLSRTIEERRSVRKEDDEDGRTGTGERAERSREAKEKKKAEPAEKGKASARNKSDADNDFPRAEVEDSRKRLLIRKPKKTDSPNRFALALIPIDITGYRSFYFSKKWPAYPKKLEELMRAADTMVKLFRDDSLTSDRESELRHGYIRDAYTFHALRSFVWTSVEYCKDNRIKLEDFDLEKSLALAQFIHDRGGANYKITDKNAKRIGAGILTKTEKDYRLTDESYVLLVDSLHTLIPIMEHAYHYLNDRRSQGGSDDTASTLEDIVAGWCAFAFACASEFEIKSGPEDSIPAKCRELPTIKNDLKVLEGHFYLKGTTCIACTKEDETVEFPEGIELISIPRNFDDISGSKEFYHGMTKIIFPSSYTCREGWLSFPPCAKEIEFQGDFGDINTPFMGSEEYCVEKVIFHGKGDRLASFAFYGAKHLKEIVLPETLREIGKCSFMQTPQLNEIRIPPDVEEIGEDAFGKSGNQSKKVLVVDKGSKAEGVVRRFVAGREDLTYKAVISPKEQKRIDEENRMRRIAAALQRKLAGAYRDSLDQGSYQSLKKELYDIVSGECDMNTWHELQALGVPYLPETLAKSTREQIATMPAQGSDYNDLPSILAKDYIQRADDKRMRLAEITETRNRNIAKLNAEAAALKDELSHLGFFQGKRKKEIASRLTSIEEQIRRENNLYEEMRKSLQ